MANPFLDAKTYDIETAILLDKAIVTDIGQAVAYTDGHRVFINTDDNLYSLLPAYDHNMLKWLLWHEEFHNQLKHNSRFFKYVSELKDAEAMDKFHLTKDEVNIIMDILVHDSLSKMFPDLVPTAETNLAQFRNRNSLGYTFKTNTLEKMLTEYAEHKQKEGKTTEPPTGTSEGKSSMPIPPSGNGTPSPTPTSTHEGDEETPTAHDSHRDGKDAKGGKAKGCEETHDNPPEEEDKEEAPAPAHDKTDWSKLKDIDSKEFITEDEGDEHEDAVARLRRKQFKLGQLTEALNGLASTSRRRSYSMPSSIHVGKGVLLKGRVPGKARLCLVFDASGSMSEEMSMFKRIISQSIPQAMATPTRWFSGSGEKITRDKTGRSYDYYSGTFADFMPVYATGGYSDDGDRTIELCLKAEQEGYSPIGVTDGGGGIYWSEDMIKQLQRTLLVGDDEDWLNRVKAINPKIQILAI